jgi:hypothetical protein
MEGKMSERKRRGKVGVEKKVNRVQNKIKKKDSNKV